ncbi:flagellar motor switch protein FliN [Blastopirellula marina]|uniref:Flagellar motor switch protein FliN n=1 Tax=Blastopirellula marina DSM 3645 TaxID=314230 RepID=A3ZNY6_9BACT|nr:flagellar motor switch protein FliN [Blastopirellula marina]EAQ82034.1 flagellar motor switch protein fliN [Blastopirellula marina DSM 3645]
MSDDQIGQDEIEELLRQASTGKLEASGETKPAAAEVESLGQNEIEALLAGAGGGGSAASSSTARPAHAAATAAPAASRDTSDSGMDPNDIEFLLNQAQAALASLDSPAEMASDAQLFQLRDFGGAPASTNKTTIDLVRDVELDVKIELGRTNMYLEDVLKMNKGSVVSLDKLAGDPVDIYVNGRMIARGEVLVLNDNFCVRIAELIVGDGIE